MNGPSPSERKSASQTKQGKNAQHSDRPTITSERVVDTSLSIAHLKSTLAIASTIQGAMLWMAIARRLQDPQ